jgi:hypothetical protein
VVVLGFTVNVFPAIVYEDAPLGSIVYEFPWQILPLLALILGLIFTEMIAIAAMLLLQPAELVPVTLYAVVVIGDTVAVLPLIV